MSIVALGDIHFRDDHPYFMEVCENFLEWYSSWERNNSDNSLILTGDLVVSIYVVATMTNESIIILTSLLMNSLEIRRMYISIKELQKQI